MNRGVKWIRVGSKCCLALAVVWFAVSLRGAVAAERLTPNNMSRVDAAIDQLSAPAFVDREIAAKELTLKGSTAIPQLEAALKTAKGETRYRIRAILAKQRLSTDLTTRRAAEQALIRLAASKDNISSAWARSILNPPAKLPIPTAIESPAGA